MPETMVIAVLVYTLAFGGKTLLTAMTTWPWIGGEPPGTAPRAGRCQTALLPISSTAWAWLR